MSRRQQSVYNPHIEPEPDLLNSRWTTEPSTPAQQVNPIPPDPSASPPSTNDGLALPLSPSPPQPRSAMLADFCTIQSRQFGTQCPIKSAQCLIALTFTLQMPLGTSLPRQGSHEAHERDAAERLESDAAERRKEYTPRWAKTEQQSVAPSTQNRRRSKSRFSRTGSYNGAEGKWGAEPPGLRYKRT